MTDREMLELAAKAAGIDWIKNCVWIENGFYSPLAKHERIAWNPLTDDGDAFRLAVKLKIGTHPKEDACFAWDTVGGKFKCESDTPDLQAAG